MSKEANKKPQIQMILHELCSQNFMQKVSSSLYKSFQRINRTNLFCTSVPTKKDYWGKTVISVDFLKALDKCVTNLQKKLRTLWVVFHKFYKDVKAVYKITDTNITIHDKKLYTLP